jgi:hypothetical protein
VTDGVKRAPGCIAWLVVSASCAATAIGSASAERGQTDRPHERQIDVSEFRARWPFTIGTGALSCEAGAVVVRLADVAYGLNDEAIRPRQPVAARRNGGPLQSRNRVRSGALRDQ